MAWAEEGKDAEPICDAEKLQMFKLQPPRNRTYREKYEGRPLHMTNQGDHLRELPAEIWCQ